MAPTGAVIYKGPSSFNGAPIVAIVTGLGKPSANPKTGEMLQLWIMPADQSPRESVTTGANRAVCGDCIHIPVEVEREHRHRDGSVERHAGIDGSCYVHTWQGPLAVFDAWKAGRYLDLARRYRNEPMARVYGRISKLFAGTSVRLGALNRPNRNEDIMTAINGWTYPVRSQLFALGGQWDKRRKVWLVPDEHAEAARALVAGAHAPRRRYAGSSYARFASGAEVFTNRRGRCEDAPCCGCCS